MKRTDLPWVTGGLILTALLAGLAPPELLEYDRGRVDAGEFWRVVTGQLVHWTPRMAFYDLGVILVLGTLLEIIEERRVLARSLWLSLVATGLAVHAFGRELSIYRGSSGIATALFAVVVLRSAKDRSTLGRIALLLSVVGFGGKIALEVSGGGLLFAGTLPAGVVAAPAAHVAGLSVGFLAGLSETAFAGAPNPPGRARQRRPTL